MLLAISFARSHGNARSRHFYRPGQFDRRVNTHSTQRLSFPRYSPKFDLDACNATGRNAREERKKKREEIFYKRVTYFPIAMMSRGRERDGDILFDTFSVIAVVFSSAPRARFPPTSGEMDAHQPRDSFRVSQNSDRDNLHLLPGRCRSS